MSAHKMIVTVLATTLAEAWRKDEAPESEGHDISAGLFGPNVSEWIKDVANSIIPDPTRPVVYFCTKCGYSGPDQLHARPGNTNVQCQYMAHNLQRGAR